MSYSFKLSNLDFYESKACFIKRNDGVWKDTPYFMMERNELSMIEKIRDFEVFEDDVWLTGYYKSGTTWAKELIWLLNNNLDYETAKLKTLSERFPFFE
jgi:hypothetical protein